MKTGVRRLMAFAAAAALCAPAFAERHSVTIDNFRFTPATLEVKVGDEIEWVNKDIVEHTATASDGAFDSKLVKPGGSWRWKAGKAGRHAYICTFHPNMSGTIEVK